MSEMGSSKLYAQLGHDPKQAAEIEVAKGFLAKIHGGVLRFPNLKGQL